MRAYIHWLSNSYTGVLAAITGFATLFLTCIKFYYLLNGNDLLWFQNTLYPYIAVHSSGEQLPFKAWVLATHSIVDASTFSWLANSLWLLVWGYFFEVAFGKKKFVVTFIVATIFAGVACIVAQRFTAQAPYYLLGLKVPLIAYAASLVVSLPLYKPWAKVGLPIPLVIIALIYFASTVLEVGHTQFVALIALAIAALCGVLIALFSKKENAMLVSTQGKK